MPIGINQYFVAIPAIAKNYSCLEIDLLQQSGCSHAICAILYLYAF